jgi:hypothetical protein
VDTVVERVPVSPDHELFDDEEEDGEGDVALEGEEIAAVNVAEGGPGDCEAEVDEKEDAVELVRREKVSRKTRWRRKKGEVR